ncbi:MAG: SulP family inorganic anion transporter [Planctomycetota bacterium]|nr:MAG: SulP family inorganic anion transporter [Planctomycetota bacterium]
MSTATEIAAPKPVTHRQDKPQNGLAGLKHWRYDLRSGFMVAMISLPFSMGIAITSGAPPVCGIMSAVIAGFVLPFMGGSYVTISGPAAGLAPALFAGMIALGDGDLAVGYPRVLVAICIAGVVQFVLAKLKVARLSAIFPAAAIEGMLAAIGLLIIVKQIPLFFGVPFEGHEFWHILREVPQQLSAIHPEVFWLGVGCTALIFTLAALPGRLFKIMPPAMWAFVLGTVVAQFFLPISPENLIHVPDAPLKNGIVLPDFRGVFAHSELWGSLAVVVVTLVLIDGAESLATIAAVDKLDPYRRKSDPDRTLLAMGTSNVASSLLGGLTIIPGIVKSTANILGGGRTQWANFYNACFLLSFLFFARGLINMVPTCVLASILIFIGYKLCRPKVWKHMASVGKEQLFIFATTVVVTVSTDLLIGLAAGVGIKFVLCLWYNLGGVLTGQGWPRRLAQSCGDLVRNPVGRREFAEGTYELHVDRPMVCFNLFHLIREMDRIPKNAKQVNLQISDKVTLIDHTTCENLLHYMDQFNNSNGAGRPRLELQGFAEMRQTTPDESSIRLPNRRDALPMSTACRKGNDVV